MADCPSFHAYVDEQGNEYPLSDHSIDTLYVAYYTSLKDRVDSIGNRLFYEENTRRIMNNLFYIAIMLHDIGKILPLYQVSRRSYIYHEFISGLILYRILGGFLDNYSNWLIPDPRIPKILVIEPVIRHHYAMNRRINVFKQFLIKNRGRLTISTYSITCLLGEIVEKTIRYNLFSKELVGLLEKMIDAVKSIDNIEASENTISEMLLKIRSYYKGLGGRRVEIALYSSALTGILALADYTAASIERGGGLKGYVANFFNRREIECIKYIGSRITR